MRTFEPEPDKLAADAATTPINAPPLRLATVPVQVIPPLVPVPNMEGSMRTSIQIAFRNGAGANGKPMDNTAVIDVVTGLVHLPHSDKQPNELRQTHALTSGNLPRP